MDNRARWDMPQNLKNKKIYPPLLYLDRKFNSKTNLFSSTFWFEHFFGCHFAILVFWPCCWENGSKTVQKMRLSKICLKLTQKWKTHKTNVYSTILGGSWRWKVVSVFTFRHSKSHFFALENGHFCKKCPFSCGKKWRFGCRNEANSWSWNSKGLNGPKKGQQGKLSIFF